MIHTDVVNSITEKIDKFFFVSIANAMWAPSTTPEQKKPNAIIPIARGVKGERSYL